MSRRTPRWRGAAPLFLSLCLLPLILGPSARAQRFEVIAQGSVASISDPNNLLDGSIQIGTPFEFDFFFTTAAASANVDPTWQTYYTNGVTPGTVFKCGDYVYTTSAKTGSTILVLNDNNVGGSGQLFDSLQMQTLDGTVAGGGKTVYHPQTTYQIYSQDLNTLTSLALPPLSVYSLAKFPYRYYGNSLYFYGFPDAALTQTPFSVGADLTSLQAIVPGAAPEPSPGVALSLGGLGVAGLGLRVRRRRVLR
jgi:hypothetical protein